MPLSCNLGTLNSWNPLGHYRPVTGLIYPYVYMYVLCIFVLCMYTYTHTHTHNCIHAYIHTYVHTYIHTYILLYTVHVVVQFSLTNIPTELPKSNNCQIRTSPNLKQPASSEVTQTHTHITLIFLMMSSL